MKYAILLFTVLIINSSVVIAENSTCVAAATSRSTVIIARDENIYYRTPATGRAIVRFTRPDSLTDREGCRIKLKSKIVYRDGTESKSRSFAKKKDLVRTKTTWTGPTVRRVLDTRPRGRENIRSILYVAADVTCQGETVLRTDFVGRYVPNCGKSPSLLTADDFRVWLSASLR